MINVQMLPHHTKLGKLSSGIAQVVLHYYKYLPQFDINLVDPSSQDYDVSAVHAGMTGAECDICHCHGMYWTADYDAPQWEYKTNAKVIDAIRHARAVTVPSEWVAEVFRRDMHVDPVVVPHGVEWHEWQISEPRSSYVLYNKNRQGDVCDASPLNYLAEHSPDTQFVSTFATAELPNLYTIGVIPHHKMKTVVQHAGIYIATTKETFGIGILEALASGVPVLGYAHGGITEIVTHGENGYLAEPDNIEDLLEGLHWCQQYNEVLSDNAREAAKGWKWQDAVEIVSGVYHDVYAKMVQSPTAAIIIPSYNYGERVGAAIKSATEQTYPLLKDIVVVDDGSQDDGLTEEVVQEWSEYDQRVRYIYKDNGGVATARNTGIAATDAVYITCLDADDAIEPEFLQTLIPALEEDPSLGIAYSKLNWIFGNNRSVIGDFPGEFNFDQQLVSRNQIPTCCVFRKEAWKRSGGYRQRYAPDGQGTEDAEFWLRLGALGWDAIKVTDRPLFLYTAGGRTQQGKRTVVDWTAWHPWTRDQQHPFASVATPGNMSHPVRQYDSPIVSVVIPVGPGHEKHLWDALDSIEAQTVRQWEVIVVLDGSGRNEEGSVNPEMQRIVDAAPFVQWIWLEESSGTSAARNIGAQEARAPFLLFLDADDYLEPRAIELMLQHYTQHEEPVIVYAESLGKRAVDEDTVNRYRDTGELVSYHKGVATVRQTIVEYNYDLAVQQPHTDKPYFWCYITSLVPTAWHGEIGGFDEELETWEDWDYWIRMAKRGKAFSALHQPIIVYNYDSGTRREYGKSVQSEMIVRLREKHRKLEEEIGIMACSGGCGKRQSQPRVVPKPLPQIQPDIELASAEGRTMNDSNFVLVQYVRPMRGSHGVIGVTTFPNKIFDNMRRTHGGWVIDYGYHSQGEVFLVHRLDAQAQSGWFRPYESAPQQKQVDVQVPTRPKAIVRPPTATKQTSPPPNTEPSKPTPPPVEMTEPEPAETLEQETEEVFDLQTLSGVTSTIEKALHEKGYRSPADILQAGIVKLQEVNGIGEVKAEAILASAREEMEKQVHDTDSVLEELENLLK